MRTVNRIPLRGGEELQLLAPDAPLTADRRRPVYFYDCETGAAIRARPARRRSVLTVIALACGGWLAAIGGAWAIAAWGLHAIGLAWFGLMLVVALYGLYDTVKHLLRRRK